MSPYPELQDFLTELGGRRLRLLSLADPGTPELLAELTELGEQLLVADEELRVQQEQLDQTRRAVERLARQRDDLWMAAPGARAVTDARGVVSAVNRATDDLLGRSAVQVTPRPIATWFEVADRSLVRSMITGLAQGRAVAPIVATLRSRDGDATRVQVLARAEDVAGTTALHWEFRPVGPGLTVVPPTGTTPAEDSAALLLAVTALAGELGTHRDPLDVVSHVVRGALTLVDGAEAAGVVVTTKGGGLTEREGGSPRVAGVHRTQESLGEGPLYECVATGSAVLVSDVATEARWPAFAGAAAALGIGSMLVVPMARRGAAATVLTLVADHRDALDAGDVDGAVAFGVHAGLALQRALTEADLRVAVESRQLIGEAVGILMERRRITSDEAFAMLVRASQNGNVKLRALARDVIDTGQEPDQIVVR